MERREWETVNRLSGFHIMLVTQSICLEVEAALSDVEAVPTKVLFEWFVVA